MRHPEILLLPVCMLADYYLTVLGAHLSEGSYRKHFVIEHYEMNPIWQKTIINKKLFNPKHLALTVGLTALLFWGLDPLPKNDPTLLMVLGFFLTLYTSILGQHISNVMLFSYLNRSPHAVSGHINLPHETVLRMSGYRNFILVLVFAMLAFFVPTWFIFGGFASMVVLTLHYGRWILKAKRAAKKSPAK